MLRPAIFAFCALCHASSAHSAMIDFESLGVPEGTELGTTIAGVSTYKEAGVTFTSTDGLRLIQVNERASGPSLGFWPHDRPNPVDAFGKYFLGTNFDDPFTDLTLTYLTPVPGLSFDIGDVDGTELFTISAFGLKGELLGLQTLDAGYRGSTPTPGTGDRSVVSVGFSDLDSLIAVVVVSAEKRNGKNLGLAFDNFNTTRDLTSQLVSDVPLPPASAMLATAVTALFLRRRRRATERGVL